ncbi:MAG: DUF6062 family protein [Nitrososphaeria archaeon]
MVKKDITTLDILDSFEKGKMCPLCQLWLKSEEMLMPYLLTNEVNMDPDFRAKVVGARGFCNRHMHLLYETAYTPGSQDGLGYALYMQDVIKLMLDKIKETKSDIEAIPLERSGMLHKREAVKIVKQTVNKLENSFKGTDSCPACEHLRQLDRLRTGTIIRMLDEDDEFRKIFSNSVGFCMPHFISILKIVSETKVKNQETVMSLLFDVETKNIEKIQSLLSKFIKRFDWAHVQKSYGEEVEVNSIVKNFLKGVEGLKI